MLDLPSLIIRVSLHSSIAYLLGLAEYLNVHTPGWINDMAKGEKKELDDGEKIIQWKAAQTPDMMRNTLRSICIFSDIIQSSFVGCGQKPLMRMLPIDVTSSQIPMGFFVVMSYHTLNTNKVSAI